MSDVLSRAKEKSRRRKELIKHTLGVDDLDQALGGSSPSLKVGLGPSREFPNHLRPEESEFEAKKAKSSIEGDKPSENKP